MEQAVYQQLRQIEMVLNRLWGGLDTHELDPAGRKSLETVRRQIRAAQAAARDYELAEYEEDTKAQLKLLPKTVKALEQLRSSILKASEYDLVGAVDVAQISAQLDELIDRLR